ncbi:MAG: hypothetical protein WA840_05570 [Caulobacteraceae bacterium]
MPRFEITFRDIALPEEPTRAEIVEADDQQQAMSIAEQRVRKNEQIVGIAPASAQKP